MVLYTVQMMRNETLKIPYPLQHRCRGCGCTAAGNYLQQIYIRLQRTYYEKGCKQSVTLLKRNCFWTKSDHNDCYVANSSRQNDWCKISCCLDIMQHSCTVWYSSMAQSCTAEEQFTWTNQCCSIVKMVTFVSAVRKCCIYRVQKKLCIQNTRQGFTPIVSNFRRDLAKKLIDILVGVTHRQKVYLHLTVIQ